jgi:ketol-acid reductoisomerase
MDYMYNACSMTARRGALDWAPVFEATNRPVFEKLYQSVRNGTETRKALEFNGRSTYRQDLVRELKEADDQEIWRAGKTVRSLRPDYKPSYCKLGWFSWEAPTGGMGGIKACSK